MISICIKINNNNILNYIMNEISKSTLSEIYCKKHEFKIYDNIIIHYKGSNPAYFYDVISRVITNCIIKFFEPSLVHKLINLDYFYFDEDDKKIIFEEYKLLKHKNLRKLKSSPSNKSFQKIHKKLLMVSCNNSVKRLIYKPLKEFLMNNKTLVLTGFVDFRLDKYMKYLENMVSESVNQYLIDKEYLKFVDLLRNYVASKIPNDVILNLIYINNEGILLTENGKFVNLEDFNSTYLADVTFSKNDYILNTLVGLLPHKIMLHLISPKDQFIKTIEMIFENKVETCSGCELCRAYELLNLH